MNTHQSQMLDILTREGVLLNVSVRYWRGRVRLKARDLGLEEGKLSDRLISLGHKKLLTKEALAPFGLIESRAHSLVEARTFPFLGGIARFLPNANVGGVRDKLAALEREFAEAKESFLADYARWQSNSLAEWRDFARRAGVDAELLLAAIQSAFPTAEKVAERFAFATRAFQVALPDSIRTQTVAFADQEAVIAAREQVAREAAARLEGDARAFVADCVATLREQTAELCAEMLGSMNTGKTDGVHQKTLNRLANFIDQFKSLNFARDTELETQLETARRELLSRTAEEYRDSAYARRQLVGGLTALKEQARQLARADAREVVERFGAMGRRKILAA